MTPQVAIYTGEDSELVVDLIDDNFADVQDVIVGFVVGQTLRKTCKKTSNVPANAVVAYTGQPTKCIARLFRSETQGWAKGPLSVEVTVVYTDANFPQGRHISIKEYLCEFDNILTKNA
jgi:hypothetical protein